MAALQPILPPMNLASISLTILLTALSLTLWLGGPREPARSMSVMNDAFAHANYAGLPVEKTFSARDGSALAYRQYTPAEPQHGSVVLVHGAAATSQSMHILAEALLAAGFHVYALDIRGHGKSGRKGRIDYVGQLEHDMADFLEAVNPPSPRTLTGYASGGGFALRVASGKDVGLFDHYVLLAPFIHQEAPTQRPDNGGWVNVGIPRFIALHALNRIGIPIFNDLFVVRFTVEERHRALLTDRYDYNLATNFRPRHDYLADLRAIRAPTVVIAGEDDEAFVAREYPKVFANSASVPAVLLLPKTDHAQLVLAPHAVNFTARAITHLHLPARAPAARTPNAKR